MSENDVFEVLETKSNKGLTVGNYSRAKGHKFLRKEFTAGNASLESAIKSGRCKMIVDAGEIEEKQKKEHLKKTEEREKLAATKGKKGGGGE